MTGHIILFGKNGQLGYELCRSLACLGEVTALDYPEIDFTHPEQLSSLITAEKPSLVVNAAAYTAVDRAESEPEIARLINGDAPGVMAESCSRIGAGFIHYSTDYVFDGKKGTPYTEKDETHPLNAYGLTKLAGERSVLAAGGSSWIFRTSWVYSNRRDSFVSKVIEWSANRTSLRIVTDQVSNPTWARALAEATSLALAAGIRDIRGWMQQTAGLYHLAGSGYASRLEWAREILAVHQAGNPGRAVALEPASSSEFPTPALRPEFTALDCGLFANTFGIRLPEWRLSLGQAMA